MLCIVVWVLWVSICYFVILCLYYLGFVRYYSCTLLLLGICDLLFGFVICYLGFDLFWALGCCFGGVSCYLFFVIIWA